MAEAGEAAAGAAAAGAAAAAAGVAAAGAAGAGLAAGAGVGVGFFASAFFAFDDGTFLAATTFLSFVSFSFLIGVVFPSFFFFSFDSFSCVFCASCHNLHAKVKEDVFCFSSFAFVQAHGIFKRGLEVMLAGAQVELKNTSSAEGRTTGGGGGVPDTSEDSDEGGEYTIDTDDECAQLVIVAVVGCRDVMLMSVGCRSGRATWSVGRHLSDRRTQRNRHIGNQPTTNAKMKRVIVYIIGVVTLICVNACVGVLSEWYVHLVMHSVAVVLQPVIHLSRRTVAFPFS